ncbi:hypothetical protein QYF61_022061 [Mycteria americana]|uniref:Uncharacterized protein n=1 Tax=Mycteria americana TaxID=33587 RepID=A0AAN7RQC8_MYCAM|nr:hypothetical protein QYF61_022061 [Mycteria americana]
MTISRFFSIAYKVRNNREEIEEKEKRGRVTLQASLLAALTEKQERGRENTGGIPLKGLWSKDKSTLDKVHLVASVAVDKVHAAAETAWKAQICLFIEKDPNDKMNISEDILNAVIPPVWASEIPGRAKNATLVKTELKPGAQSVRKKQYPVKPEARKGLNL